MSLSRRGLLSASAASFAFAGFARFAEAENAPALLRDAYTSEVTGYGPLEPDPAGLFDLPKGFRYTVVDRAGDAMSDGLVTPHKFDGMGCFPLDGERVILIRNHELRTRDIELGPFGPGRKLADKVARDRVYDRDLMDLPLNAGTTSLVYDLKKRRLETSHLSLCGTVVNCAGGRSLQGSWLSCEETTQNAGEGVSKSHGWVFEVPAGAKGVVEPNPIRGMGRFKHEAVAFDPRTGIAYLTEDMNDGQSLFYRYLPADLASPLKAGKLQALAFIDAAMGRDSRNWGERLWSRGDRKAVRWIDLDGVDNPYEDLRWRGHEAGAAWFARGEGIYAGKEELFFTCTSGGPGKLGQIMRYVPSPYEGKPEENDQRGQLQLYLEPADPRALNMGDNIAISPWGHLFICEDKGKGVNYLRALTADGKLYTVGRNPVPDPRGPDVNSELAGICFSPDGTTMFVNVYYPGVTLAITGPWSRFRR